MLPKTMRALAEEFHMANFFEPSVNLVGQNLVGQAPLLALSEPEEMASIPTVFNTFNTELF
jgi:hypothetical protein